MTKRNFAQATRARRLGSTLIEFAFVFVMLIVLTLGLVQYAILASASVALSQVARAGARYAAVEPGSDANIRDKIREATPPQIDFNDLTIVITPTDPAQRLQFKTITVSITYDLKNKMFLPSQFFGVQIIPRQKTVTAAYMLEKNA